MLQPSKDVQVEHLMALISLQPLSTLQQLEIS
jgi:hypothetical protein